MALFTHQSSLQHKPQTHHLFLSPLVLPFASKPHRFPVSSSISLPPLPKTQLWNLEVKQEVSKTRLIAQIAPWSCTIEDIRSLFQRYGTVVDVEVYLLGLTRNRGLAFVSMASPQEALAALKSRSTGETQAGAGFNLFVANIPYESRAKHLKELFSSQGANDASAEVIFHDNQIKSFGYGFVSFKFKKEAEAALSAFQGKE
ncbi:RNA recognition motif-containing protein [Hibiscus syriacus]|uniref:RNA recognition motif-containing protein n=1 Tax=Hibiscus syriacus TaxID=106335 RepID=A0A6A2XJE8_HIBSY|nr:RNA recognition motif-containing protein [Hibiscus syriacus]